ncbi:D-serine ammonia-lyase [Lentibacillus sp. N15]|uniref:D-serine ammonia-lyase n=1 Tax=Lentibacillus songyuanensis TaxID=3136161 RepID=UPI0031BA61FC
MVFSELELQNYKRCYPLLTDIVQLHPVIWLHPPRNQDDELPKLPVRKADMIEAEQLWQRFAPFLAKAFPATNGGVVESPLRPIPSIKKRLERQYALPFTGNLYLKSDNELPIAGSIKARGGIYEVLQYAEKLACGAGLITQETNYDVFASESLQTFFSQYSIGVGSTGNLGLSIGIISAKLGFHVTVYMSSDAKQWKKDLLREKGATVEEFSGDFSEAIHEGREQTEADPMGYFVDDEDSEHLFIGYSVAALRLEKQLAEQQIKVDEEHPLFVYLPCGVGGSPGGITFGLKQVFGEYVHCFFVEPTHSPSMLIGLLTGEQDNICVQDFGLDNHTEADGLAVGRPSHFATSISDRYISGIYTIADDELYRLLYMLADSEGIYIEPSAAAGLSGPGKVAQTSYASDHQLNMNEATHIVWATGGALVPKKDMEQFYEKGKKLMDEAKN